MPVIIPLKYVSDEDEGKSSLQELPAHNDGAQTLIGAASDVVASVAADGDYGHSNGLMYDALQLISRLHRDQHDQDGLAAIIGCKLLAADRA
ncbi:MAG: hypothetical protein K0U59_11970 [Gammaproteobacteria bacterium]|nr:hypothetical protein [Gammaproteobacteria bacterium]